MKAVAINVGANGGTPGGRGPIYSDGSFRFVPITESDKTVREPTYRNLGLADIRPERVHDTVAHFDPEFLEFDYGHHYTYGDRHPPKTTELAKLESGDVLFFYATLSYADDIRPEQGWINEEWGAYLIGHFTLARDPVSNEDYSSLPSDVRDRVSSNAHLRRERFDAKYLILGDPNGSSLYETPVPLSAEMGSDANRIMTQFSEDSGAGPWYRRPLRFNAEATETILQIQQTQDFSGF